MKKKQNNNKNIIGAVILIFAVIICFNISQKYKLNRTLEKTKLIITSEPTCQESISKSFLENPESIESDLKESKEYSWKGQKYLGFIYKCESEEIFLFIQNKNIIFTYSDTNLELGNLKDINADGLAELTLVLDDGTMVLRIAGDEVNDLLSIAKPPVFNRILASNIQDLNKDGKDEIIISNPWNEIMWPSQELVPFHEKILKWKDSEYKESSGEFKKYYQDTIDFRNGYLEILTTKLDNPKAEEILSLAVMNYLDYAEIGKKDLGYDEFWRQTDTTTWPKRIVLTEAEKKLVETVRQKIKETYKPTTTNKEGVRY